ADSGLHRAERGRVYLQDLRADTVLRRDRPLPDAVRARGYCCGDHLPRRGRRRVLRHPPPRHRHGRRHRSSGRRRVGGHRGYLGLDGGEHLQRLAGHDLRRYPRRPRRRRRSLRGRPLPRPALRPLPHGLQPSEGAL
ncbi:MAG: hypothetical protein AVDCRST_MAG03-1630, partial [uncultured Rubrobacteraceae bacterium]